MNYRGNAKYVLVLVQCHDGIITTSVLVLDSCKTEHRYLVRDNGIVTLDSNQKLIFYDGSILASPGSVETPGRCFEKNLTANRIRSSMLSESSYVYAL